MISRLFWKLLSFLFGIRRASPVSPVIRYTTERYYQERRLDRPASRRRKHLRALSHASRAVNYKLAKLRG